MRFAARMNAMVTIATAAALLAGMSMGVRAGALPQVGGTVVLDTFSIWRMHSTIEAIVLSTGEKVRLCNWLKKTLKTAPPAEQWMDPDFNDRFWLRGPVGLAPRSPLVARVCARGKFTVTDRGSAKGLLLTAAYRGGIVVYVNGKEIHREHIAGENALADGPGGEERILKDLPVPGALLKKGTNVIGIEIVRAPYPIARITITKRKKTKAYPAHTCELMRVLLRAADASGLIANARRPLGLQVWNADVLAGDQTADFPDRAEGLRPVVIVGARNGLFSGKVMVGSTRPIRGLTVTPGDLRSKAGAIPASAMSIRYGSSWGFQQNLTDRARRERDYPYLQADTRLLDALVIKPLKVYPVAPTGGLHQFHKESGPKPVAGAVVSIWMSVQVPRDAEAGTYDGTVRIEVQGEKPVDVPVTLRVAEATLPDTQDFRTWIDIIQCPDTLALEYKVPLWSDRHFELIGRSLKIIGETGCRILYIPLIAHTNLGNEQSMVRWVRKGNRYEYDFSVMEKYLDVVEANMGTPKVLVFVTWDVYMVPNGGKGQEIDQASSTKRGRSTVINSRNLLGGRTGAPKVTVLNRATGRTGIAVLPPLFDAAASRPLWKPLFDELRGRLKKRGLDKTMMLGLFSDGWATRQEVELLHELTGGAPWVSHSHLGHPDDKLLYGVAPLGYQAQVWRFQMNDWHSKGGWRRKHLVVQFYRSNAEKHPCTRWRHLPEMYITGNMRGLGRQGGDYWMAVRNKRGKRVGRAYERYPESSVKQLCIQSAMLAPGPDGPAATDRLEALRQGVQECEAHIIIEKALIDKTLKDKDLIKRCSECLRQRRRAMFISLSDMQCNANAHESSGLQATNWKASNVSGHNWFLSSGWQERTYQLFVLAGEVQKKLRIERKP